MAKVKRRRNPFYFLLVPVGVAFVVTAFSFGLMAYQQSRPGARSLQGEVGLMPLLDQHGMTILGVEVALIAVFSCAAIGTDEYWQRRGHAIGGQEDANSASSQMADAGNESKGQTNKNETPTEEEAVET